MQSTRPTRVDALPHDVATGLVEAWARFPVHESTKELLWEALALKERYRWSYWDAAIVASARLMGCAELWSEDLQQGLVIDGLRILNPFPAA